MVLNKKKYIHLVIMLILTFGISILPPFGQVTEFGMRVLGVFIGVLYGWIAFDLFWSSLFGFAMIAAFNLNTIGGAVSAGLGNEMIINVMLSMAFAVAVDLAGVTGAMANWLLRRKIIRRSPWFLICGMLIIGAVIGCVGPGLAVIFLLWSITSKIADYCDIKKGDPLLSFVLMMIPVCTITSSLLLPFRGSALIYLAYLAQVTSNSFETLPFILFGLVTTILIFILMIIVCRFVFHFDVKKFGLPDEIIQDIEKKVVTKKQKISLQTVEKGHRKVAFFSSSASTCSKMYMG